LCPIRCFPQTIDILKTRALPHGYSNSKIGELQQSFEFSENTFGVMLQYPDMSREIVSDYRAFVEKAKAQGNALSV
jgi:glycine cleavage system pyridoxal-binding protein P